MADDMETWIKKESQRLAAVYVRDDLEIVEGAPKYMSAVARNEAKFANAIAQFALSALMRERESKWIKIDDTARDGQRYMLGWNDRTLEGWLAPGRFVYGRWLTDSAQEVAPPTHYQILGPPPPLDFILGDEER